MTNSRRRVVLALVAGVVIGGVAVAAVFAMLGDSKEDGTPTPAVTANGDERWPPVDPEVADQTLRYLEGDAALVMLVHRTARDLGAAPARAECDAATAVLDREAPTDQVQVAIAGIPDEPLRAVMDGERMSLGLTLTRCAGGEVSGDVAPLDELAALVQERLEQLEAAR